MELGEWLLEAPFCLCELRPALSGASVYPCCTGRLWRILRCRLNGTQVPALWGLLRPRPQLPGCSAPPLGQAGLRALVSAVALGVAGLVPALRQEAGQVVGGAQPPKGAVAQSRVWPQPSSPARGQEGQGGCSVGAAEGGRGRSTSAGRPAGLPRQRGGCRHVLLSPELRAESSLNPLSQRGPAVWDARHGGGDP